MLSFLLCTVVMELLHGALRGAQTATPDLLEEAIIAHFRQHLEAFGEEFWAFKFHMGMRVPDMWRRVGILLACWILERKHKLIKRFIQDQKNPKGYEMHLMRQLTAQHIHDWQNWRLTQGLIRPREAPATVLGALREVLQSERPLTIAMGAVLSQRGGQAWRGDVVLLDASRDYACGEVWFHVSEAGLLAEGNHL